MVVKTNPHSNVHKPNNTALVNWQLVKSTYRLSAGYWKSHW